MIVPSIDLVGGQAVQLVGGEALALEADDPRELMRSFSPLGEVAVIDIDAARGEGDNSELIKELSRLGRVRVGGGIRDTETALRWLDSGADKVIIGTAASEDLLTLLPAERVIVALDSRDGMIATHGWRKSSDTTLEDGVVRFRDLCGGLLITIIEREGLMEGTDLGLAARIVELAGTTRVTVAGGVTTAGEIDKLDQLGADAQVGMALYTGQLGLAEAFTAPLVSDRADGLWPTVVTDERGVALGLVWSDLESVATALETSSGVYRSRSRGLWIKGETSGSRQELIAIDVDCDRDALRFRVRQSGSGFCHLGSRSCWGPDNGIPRLDRRIWDIAERMPERSNTARLLRDPALLGAKLREEAAELADAEDTLDIAHEAADLIYFALVKAAAGGVDLSTIERILDDRESVISHRPMESKEAFQ